MSIANERSASLLQAQFRALTEGMARRGMAPADQSTGQVLTVLMRHGGAYTLLDRDMMTARLLPLLSGPGTPDMAQEEIANFVNSIGDQMATFFSHLVPTTGYVLDSSLISHLTFPGRGLTFTYDQPVQPPGLESPTIPAAFTFVGQFIDHDLTMNAVNLFDPQAAVQNTASPLIDLDSVYGPRTFLYNLPPSGSLFNDDGTFRLKKKSDGKGGHYYDLPRDKDTHKAYIADARNDENQMVLQLHLLIIRVHNKLIRTKFHSIPDVGERIKAAYLETLYTWQSVILDDYLPRILYKGKTDTLAYLLRELWKKNFGAFKYKPCLNLATNKYEVSLPHEFAIGFRFGHSQLKPRYLLRSTQKQPIPLFNNALTADKNGNIADLRGSQPLIADHLIDFPFFAGEFKSNLIDGKVTSVVFDLPESAIPDDIKFVGNLPQRNLIRSSQVGLCAGEDLAAFYGMTPLTPKQVDPDETAWPLYGGEKDFRTPLWYYLLKEAEIQGQPRGSLGMLGSRLVGEVILGAIDWGEHSVLRQKNWRSAIPLKNKNKVTLLDLAAYVQGD